MSDVTTELAMEASDKAMEVARLKAENAKLRDELDAAKHDLSLFSERIVELGAENAELRELVRDLWKACPADGYYCIHHCEHYDKESESHCKLEDRMAELGVDE